MPPTTRQTPVAFFYEHAGYGYDPKTETPEQGRQRGAEELAKAEAWARENGYRFEWEHDGYADRSGIEHDGPLWVCLMLDAGGDVQDALGGIDLGENGTPGRVAGARVIEAELALEAMQ